MRGLIKQVYFNFLDISGINQCAQRKNRPSLTILTYHSVVDNQAPWQRFEYRNSVTQKLFEQHMRFLLKAFKPISLSEAVQRLKENNLNDNYVVVTFDDGYRNNFTRALPVLKKLNIPAAFFVTTNLLQSADCLWTDWITYLLFRAKNEQVQTMGMTFSLKSFHEREIASVRLRQQLKGASFSHVERVLNDLKTQLKVEQTPTEFDPERYAFMDWQEARAMAEQGMEIGSHTHRHALLSMLTPDEARKELKQSKELIEKHLNKPCVHFAYPNGGKNDFNDTHIQLLKELGYQSALTQIPGKNRPGDDLYRLRRINISNQMNLPVFKAYVVGTYAK